MRYWLLSLFIIPGLLHAATWNISYPKSSDSFGQQDTYPLQVLALALQHTNIRYKVTPTRKVVTQRRAIEQLKANREINIVWSMTDTIREEELLPVRIPIYKGLTGLRLFLVDEESADLMSPIQQLPELRSFIPIQSYEWPDTKILQANGFEVVAGTTKAQMYNLLKTDRVNFFPRSVIEIWDEMNSNNLPTGLSLEKNLAVHYPTATYFFFNKKNVVLANLVKTGLERAIADGSFDELFASVHKARLKKAKLDERIIFELENPLLPPETPINKRELWFDSGSFSTSQ